MRLRDSITAFFLDHEYAPKSREWAERMLSRFETSCTHRGVYTTEKLTIEDVRAFFEETKTRVDTRTGRVVGDRTVAAHARAVRTFVRWGVKEGVIADEVALRLRMPKYKETVIVPFTPKHIELLLTAAGRELPGRVSYPLRNRALVLTLLDSGARINELVTLPLPRLHFDGVGAWFVVDGKGRKQRSLTLGRTAARALHAYVVRERPEMKDADLPWVFLSQQGQFTKVGVWHLLDRLVDVAGREHFTGVRVSPHTFRHTYACTYMRQGGDIYTLSRTLGHTNVAITERYLAGLSQEHLRPSGHSVLDKMQLKMLS